MEHQTDRSLWAASCSGDGEAFVTLVGRHQRAVSAITLAATGDSAHSEDLAQETFLLAWRHIGRLREPDKIAAWLCTIARNLGRRANRRDRIKTNEPPSAELPSHSGSPEDLLAARQEHAAVWTALAELPLNFREPLILAYRDGRSSHEIAALLGLTVGAVDQRLSRGRKQLRLDVTRRLEPALAAADPGDRVRRRVAAMLPLLSPMSSSLVPFFAFGFGLLTMKKLIALAALLALVAGLLAWGLGRREEPTIAPTIATATALPHAAAPVVGVSPLADRRDALRDKAQHVEPTDNGAGSLVSLELTTLGNVATVNLHGGPSRAIVYQGTSGEFIRLEQPAPAASAATVDAFQNAWEEAQDAFDDTDPAPVREIRGTVVSADGTPVPGAVVLAGSVGLRNAGGEPHAWGSAGAKTDVSGTFRLEVAADTRATVLAMKGEQRSGTVALAPGSAPANVSLRLDAGAWLVGETLRAGEGTPAHVQIENATTRITYTTQSDGHGRFTLEGLAGGHYIVRARSESGVEAPKTRGAEVEVEVADSGPTKVQLDLPGGGLLALSLSLPTNLAEASAVIRLLSGRHILTDRAALRDALNDASRDGNTLEVAQSMRAGTRHRLEDVVEFGDLAPGDYTVCTDLTTVGEAVPTGEGSVVFHTEPLAFACATTSLAPGAELAELEIVFPG